MDALPNFTTPAVDATSPQLDITRNELPEDDILEVTEYHGTAHAYSSDDDVYYSDHPSEDPSDLALAVRDASFVPVPLMVGRTYSSSGESFGIAEFNGVDHMVEDIATFGDGIHIPAEHSSNYMDRGDSNEEREDDGYASVEDNIENNDDIGSAFNFQVTDLVPTCRAQELFVMAWNGETSSCGEDVGDIETIPSDAEITGMDDEDRMSKGECGSIHTLESSQELGMTEETSDTPSPRANTDLASTTPVSATGITAQKVSSCSEIEIVARPNRCITSHSVFSKDTSGNYSSAEYSLSSETKEDVMSKTGIIKAGEMDKSKETYIELGRHSKRDGKTKATPGKKGHAFKHFTKLFARCLGRD